MGANKPSKRFCRERPNCELQKSLQALHPLYAVDSTSVEGNERRLVSSYHRRRKTPQVDSVAAGTDRNCQWPYSVCALPAITSDTIALGTARRCLEFSIIDENIPLEAVVSSMLKLSHESHCCCIPIDRIPFPFLLHRGPLTQYRYTETL